MAQQCGDPKQALAMVEQRWEEAQPHLTPGMKDLLQEGVEDMQSKLAALAPRGQQQ